MIMRHYFLLLFAITMSFTSCVHIVKIPFNAVTNCRYDSSFVLLASSCPCSRLHIPIKLLHPECDDNCCNMVSINKIYHGASSINMAKVSFREGEVESTSLGRTNYWVACADLVVWIIPCSFENISVYSTSVSTNVVCQLHREQYYKGIILDVENSRVCLRIESIEGELVVTGWVDRANCLCASANGEC